MNALDTPLAAPADLRPESAPDHAPELAERANRQVARRRRAYWILGGGAVAIVVVLAATAAYVERSTFYQPAWEATERLKAEGLPTTWEEAQAAAPRPPAELDGTTEWDAFLQKHERSIQSFDRLDVDKSLKKAEPWLAELRELAASGKYRVASYPTSSVVGDDYMVVLYSLDAEIAMGRFLVELAKKRHDDGDTDGAAEALALSLALTANARYEPFLVCRLSGVSRLGYAADGIEPLLENGGLSSARLVQLQQALERCDLEVGLDSMRLHELLIQRDYAIEGRLADVNLNPLEKWLARHSLLRQLELLDRLRVAQSLPPDQRLERMIEIDAEYAGIVEEEEAYTPEKLASVVHAEFRSMNALQALTFVEADVRRRLLIAALACRRFELDRDELPREWEDVEKYGVADPPTNPWTGQSMTLERLPDGGAAIESPWPAWELEIYEERRQGELDKKPCQKIVLPPRTTK